MIKKSVFFYKNKRLLINNNSIIYSNEHSSIDRDLTNYARLGFEPESLTYSLYEMNFLLLNYFKNKNIKLNHLISGSHID
jgi:hypothetical protein